MTLNPKALNPFEEPGSAVANIGRGFIPPIDVYEEADRVVVETPLAGVDPKDVEVTVEGGVLTIRGKTEHRTEVDEKNYLYKEVRYGAFQRKVALPALVQGEAATATSEHGLLRITLPKKDAGKQKEVKIEIKNK
jgi:HSP20 family protein